MSENLMDMKNIKEFVNLGKNLLDMSSKGQELSADDIQKKAIKDIGFTAAMFGDLSNIGTSLKMLGKANAILSQMGISKDMLDKALSMATSLTKAGDLGKKSLQNDSNNTLADIGLSMDMFKDMDKLGKSLSDLASVSDLISGANNSKSGQKDILGTVGNLLNIMKKK